MSALPERPLSVLVAALGGEGGGVLADWLVGAAQSEGFPVQRTAIPGVAQRTGATTYYIEIFPTTRAELAGREPILTLVPSPGGIDLMVASELMEAGRALQNGFVSPDRTTLIASTHRVYSVTEKAALGDGRFEAGRVLEAARVLARQRILADLAALARESGSIINAVLLGAIAGSGVLPLSRQAYEAAVAETGIAVAANLEGFATGFDIARAGTPEPQMAEPAAPPPATPPANLPALEKRLRETCPAELHELVGEAVARLADYQNAAYAGRYLDRLDGVLAADQSPDLATSRSVARHLAAWMSYQDVIRVADLKTRSERLRRVRTEVGAKPGQPLRIVDYLKPGLEELCSLLPTAIARPLLAWAERTGRLESFNIGLHIPTSSVSGFVLLRLLGGLRWWRPRSFRFGDEQTRIEAWLATVTRAAALDADFALQVAETARLHKGYGETYRRGRRNFDGILEAHVAPRLAAGEGRGAAAAVEGAIAAALAVS
jgi:indolepyruvate ferredoxin oxidoreductase beta subunit